MAKRRSKYIDVKGFAPLLNVSTDVVDEWIEKSILSRKSYFRVLGITRIKTSDALKELHEYSNLNHPSDMKSEISTNEGSKNRTGNQQKLSQEIQSKKNEISEVFTKRNQRRTQTRSQEIIVIEESPEEKSFEEARREEDLVEFDGLDFNEGFDFHDTSIQHLAEAVSEYEYEDDYYDRPVRIGDTVCVAFSDENFIGLGENQTVKLVKSKIVKKGQVSVSSPFGRALINATPMDRDSFTENGKIKEFLLIGID